MKYKKSDVSVNYILSMPDPSSHFFEVQIKLSGLKDKHLELIMPVWRPGRYFIFDFASGVQEFKATGKRGRMLRWRKTDKCKWDIQTGSNCDVTVFYKVYANEFALRTRGLDELHAFVNCATVFLYPKKYRHNRLKLKVLPFNDWHVTTGLENFKNKKNIFLSPDYDYLADCPLEIGNQKDYSFDVEGIEHVFSIFGDAEYDIEKIKTDLALIIKKNYEFWGSVPYSRYVFITHCTPNSGGGTEHLNSTIIGVKPDAFLDENSYKNFLRLVSHEFFHTWNVKQLRPKGITPYDYTKENYLEELWIAEGSTSYYDSLMLCRTGQLQHEDILKEITKTIEDDRKRPGNLIQSLAESSFDAWVKFWKGTQQSYGSETDYYKKGADVSLILDLEIRQCSNNKHSLDDVFKTMYKKFPLGKGYTNSDFIKVCSKFAGIKLNGFFDNYLYGTKPIEWEKFLSYAGLELQVEKEFLPVIGIVLNDAEGRAVIVDILQDSLAEKAGFKSGDEIIAVEGVKADFSAADKSLKELNPCEKFKLTFFRNNELKNITLTFDNSLVTKYKINMVSNPTYLQKSIFEGWLGVKW